MTLPSAQRLCSSRQLGRDQRWIFFRQRQFEMLDGLVQPVEQCLFRFLAFPGSLERIDRLLQLVEWNEVTRNSLRAVLGWNEIPQQALAARNSGHLFAQVQADDGIAKQPVFR